MNGRTIILIFAVVNLLSGLGLAVCGVLDLNATGPNSGEGGLLSTCLGGLELAGGLLLLASAGGLFAGRNWGRSLAIGAAQVFFIYGILLVVLPLLLWLMAQALGFEAPFSGLLLKHAGIGLVLPIGTLLGLNHPAVVEALGGHRVSSDKPFLVSIGVLGGAYVLIILLMVLADVAYLDLSSKPVTGPNLALSSKYGADRQMPIRVKPGRRYILELGPNDRHLDNGGETLTSDDSFIAKSDEVTLGGNAPELPITASIKQVAKIQSIQSKDNTVLVVLDVNHALDTGQFIRVGGAQQGVFNGIQRVSDPEGAQFEFHLSDDAGPPSGDVAGDLELTIPNPLVQAFKTPEIRYSIMLSLFTCTYSTVLSILVAVPIGYLMSRFEFRGKPFIDTILDIPIVLPPLVIGLSLLILFNYLPNSLSDLVVYAVPAVVLAQFMVACAFAVRTMRVTFDQIPARYEQVAMTLGSNRSQAFWRVILPQARGGLLAAATLAWARSLGEFGPILVFAGSTRFRTEVLPTSVYLEMQAGNTAGMLAISLIMIAAAAVVFILARTFGMKKVIA